jgi:acetyltransferase-like isoleucine patch superfamily enzyme
MAFQPYIMGAAILTLGGSAYEGQISGAVFTPSASVTTWTAINSDTHSFTSPATWVLDLNFAQDVNDDGALSRYLHENEGLIVPAVLTPIGEGATVTANVTLTPGAIGGESTAVSVSTVQLGSTKPVLSAVVP